MKCIKSIFFSIIGLIVLAVLVLWGLGHRPGAGTFEVSIMINRTPAEIFPLLLDESMTKKWVSAIVKIDELTPLPAHVGTKIVITEKISGQTVVIDEEISGLKPPFLKQYISRGTRDPASSFTEYGEYELQPKDGGTLFTMRSKIEYHGFLYSLLEPILTMSVREKFAGDLQTLKKLAESQPPTATK